jgi:hypothetical protein
MFSNGERRQSRDNKVEISFRLVWGKVQDAYADARAWQSTTGSLSSLNPEPTTSNLQLCNGSHSDSERKSFGKVLAIEETTWWPVARFGSLAAWRLDNEYQDPKLTTEMQPAQSAIIAELKYRYGVTE